MRVQPARRLEGGAAVVGSLCTGSFQGYKLSASTIARRALEMRKYLIVCGLFCAVLISAKGASATDRYTVCVGDCSATGIGPLPMPGAFPPLRQVNYRFDCAFAKANPNALAEAAAKRVCLIEQAKKNYTGFDFIRYEISPGIGECGRELYYVLCK